MPERERLLEYAINQDIQVDPGEDNLAMLLALVQKKPKKQITIEDLIHGNKKEKK